MLMYILTFVAAWRLRARHAEVARPFRVPLLPLVALIGALAAAAIVIGLTPPAQFSEGSLAAYGLMRIGGVALLALPPQFIDQFRRAEWRDEAVVAAAANSD